MTDLTVDSFTNLLWNSDKAVERALLALDQHGGIDVEDEELFYEFLSCIRSGKHLTQEQLRQCRSTIGRTNMRIAKYIEVLLSIAVQRKHDLLCLEYSDVVDTDDITYIKPVVDKLREFERKHNVQPYHITGSIYDEQKDE
jgi:hypothetical protein